MLFCNSPTNPPYSLFLLQLGLSCTINEIKKAKPITKLVKVVCLADNLLIITIWGALTYS